MTLPNLPVLKRGGMHFITKISSYCNLRCTYCYEFPFLANKQRMSIEQAVAMFRNVGPVAARTGEKIRFVWHGGEPLMIELDYYREIARQQHVAFDGGVNFENTIQSNLTIMNDRIIDFIREGVLFTGIGFSFDVYGEQRVDIKGRPTDAKVLKNLQMLLDADIPIGGITVLTRKTVGKLRNIFDFYNDLGLDFRLLPFHIESVAGQTDESGISPSEITAAFCAVVDWWFETGMEVNIEPLEQYLVQTISFLSDGFMFRYDKKINESSFIIGSQGGVSGVGDHAGTRVSYGNIFEQPFDEILDAPARLEEARLADVRQARWCGPCKFFGHCNGGFIANANEIEIQGLETHGCYVASVMEHMVMRLNQGLPELAALAVGARDRNAVPTELSV
jgi:uncharacterized protein